MTTTIDTTSAAATGTAQTSSKPYIDMSGSSSHFDNILKTVSDSYSSQKAVNDNKNSALQNSNKKPDYRGKTDDKKADNSSDNKTNDVKQKVNEPEQKTSAQKPQTDKKEAPKNDSSNTDTKKNASDPKTDSADSAPQGQTTAQTTTQTSAQTSTQTTAQTTSQEPAQPTAPTPIIPVDVVQITLPAASDNTQTQNQTKQTDNDKTKDNQQESQPIIPQMLPNVNVNLTQAPQTNDNSVTNQTQNTKIQPQTQQVLSNMQVNQQDTTAQPAQGAQPAQATQADTSLFAQKDTQPIVIESNVQNTNSTDNTNSTAKTDNKTPLTQEAVNKTNAKVVSIETSNASNSNNNSNNLLNKQDTQDQVVKLSLENTKTSHDINTLPNAADSIAQTALNKTAETMQTEAPKELNKADVMSQINNQLDKLQDNTTTKVTIVLKPENLGKIELELVSSKDGLTAKMTTDSQQVKELLDKNINSLKDTLGSQGVNVNNVSVKVNEAQKQDTMFSFENQNRQGQAQQQNQSQNQSQQGNNQGQNYSYAANTETMPESSNEELETPNNDNATTTGIHQGQVDYKV